MITVEGNLVSISCATVGAAITYSYTQDGVAKATDVAYAAPFSVEGYGEFVVTAKATADGLDDSQSSKTFTLEAPLTLAEFLAQKPAADKNIAGPLQTIWQNGNYVYVRDNEGTYGLLNGSVTAGQFATQKVIASLTAKYEAKNSKQYIVPSALGAITVATEQIEPAEGTIADVTTDNFAKYYVIKGVSVEEFNGYNSNIKVGSQSAKLYNEFHLTLPTINTSAKYDVTGFVGCYNSGAQFWPIDIKEVVDQNEFTYNFKNLTVVKDETPALDLPDIMPTLSFSSSDENVAYVEDGYVYAVGLGTATITVSWDETAEWKGGSAEFTVTVTKKAAGLAWSAESATVALGNDSALPTLSIADGLEYTLSSSDDAVAAVSPDGKSIWMLAEGTATITATFAESSDYAGESVSYTLTVTKQLAVEEVAVTFDFTKDKVYGMTAQSGNSSTYNETTESPSYTFSEGEVTVTTAKGDSNGTRLWNKSGSYEYRVNKGASFTVSVPSNCTLKSITFEQGTAVSDVTITDDAEDKTSYTFTNADKQIVVKKMTVTYTKPGTAKVSAGLYFNRTLHEVTVKEPYTTKHGVSAAKDVTVEVKVLDAEGNEITDGDPYVTSTTNGTLEILSTKYGSYKLVAYAAGTDKYLPAVAYAELQVLKAAPTIDFESEDDNIIITAAGMNIYYKIVSAAQTKTNAPAKFKAANADGWEVSETGEVRIPKSSVGDGDELVYYAEDPATGEKTVTTHQTRTANGGWTGISDIAAEGAQAPAEFYNLQGVRVANPAAGNVYIVRRGNKVTKVLVK